MGFYMSANSMRKHVQILAVEDRKSKSGNMYQVAQCVVHGDQIKVGELWSFSKIVTLVPGDFLAEFEITVDMERKVTAELVAMHPVAKPGAAAKA